MPSGIFSQGNIFFAYRSDSISGRISGLAGYLARHIQYPAGYGISKNGRISG